MSRFRHSLKKKLELMRSPQSSTLFCGAAHVLPRDLKDLPSVSKLIERSCETNQAEIHFTKFTIIVQCTSLIEFYHRIILLYVFILAQANFFMCVFRQTEFSTLLPLGIIMTHVLVCLKSWDIIPFFTKSRAHKFRSPIKSIF